jgi:sugar lactone lactonase YvrE
LVETGRTYPNGIAFDRNGNLIWAESYSREIKKHESGGQLSKIGVLKGDSVPDGIKVTEEGKILICACGSGLVEIMDETGALGVALHAGEFPTNCAVSGDFLYVTDGGLPGEGRQAAPLGRLSRLRIPPSY